MTSVPSLPAGDRALYSQLHQILHRPGLLLGSLVTMRRSCGKGGCRCRKDPRRRHRSLYVSVRVGRQRRLVYVPPDWEDRVSDWIGRYRDVRGLLKKISEGFLRRLRQRQP